MYDRILLTSYPRYSDAQAAVDRLSDAHFPVEEVSIVGRDLKLVEDVTGRLSYGRAALSGAAGGAWVGVLFGLFIGLFAADGRSALALLLWGLLFGALGGALLSVAAYALTGGRRDFVSVSQLVAERYDVTVDARTADDARQILSGGRPTGARRVDGASADGARADRARVDATDSTDSVGTDGPPVEEPEATGRGGWRARVGLR
jgi:hypothetical protein